MTERRTPVRQERFQSSCSRSVNRNPNHSARFWPAAALCRFTSLILRRKSGGGLPQARMLTRYLLNPGQLFGYSFWMLL